MDKLRILSSIELLQKLIKKEVKDKDAQSKAYFLMTAILQEVNK